MKKKTVKKLLALTALVFSLTACSNGGETSDPTPTPDESGPVQSAQLESKTIAVLQYATHASLDNCYTGFVQGLAEGGYTEGENLTIEFQNANAIASDCDLMAKNMIATGYDLVAGIATPAAMALYGAARDTDIPVIFSAVSDPVSAGIVQSLEAPGYNCTGTSDELDLDAQVAMIRGFLPDAAKIGIIYTTSEPNSITQLERIKEIAPNYGFEILSVGITNPSEVATAAASLVSSGVNCFNNFTDNLVVENLSQMLNAADEAGIPIFGSEEEQVRNGCLACQGIDYIALGQETGRMAAKVLSGEAEAGALPVYVTSEYAPFYNSAVAQAMGLSLPEDYSNAVDVAQ
ncbi:MAG: ABC transporter substrate-binding protein [Clostridiales bacterium]|nr:ABC transporter substrate-binding protein [Clostridiales bacterium]